MGSQISESPNLALGPEWAILELLCLGLTSPAEKSSFEELIMSRELSWGELLEQAIRHKILPLLAYHTTSSTFEELIPRFVWRHLHETLRFNRYKTIVFRREAARLIEALQQQDVVFVNTKGIVFESCIYGGNGSRNLDLDIDFMILPKYRDTVCDIVDKLGYELADYDWASNKTKPHSRKDLMIFKLNPDHLPAFTLLTGDTLVPGIQVDFANSLTWARSPYEVPIEIALENRCFQPIPGHTHIQMPSFTPEFQFVFTVLHLFREAWFERWVNAEQDVNLLKFGDVIRLWRTYESNLKSGKFIGMLQKFEIVEPILWVLEHLDRTLGTVIVDSLGLQGQLDEEWLSSAYVTGGGVRTWQGTIRERLFNKNIKEAFDMGESAKSGDSL